MRNKLLEKSSLLKIVVSMIIILATIFSVVAISQPASTSKSVYAEDVQLDENQVIGRPGTGLYAIDDERLYDVLWDYYLNTNPEATNLTVGCFKNLTQFPAGLFNNKNIESIDGLFFFMFYNLKTLDLSNNQIKGKVQGFANMSYLETLDLSNNKITSFNGSFSSKLKSVNLKNNKLTVCDISTLTENGSADLSFNMLSSFEKITLPTVQSQINLTHNNIIENVPQNLSCTLNMGLQGLANLSGLNSTTTIRYYHSLDNVSKIEVYKKVGENSFQLLNQYSADAELTNFEIGEYKLVFVETESEKLYQDILFSILPNKPTYQIFVGDEQLDTMPYVITQSAVVKIIGEGEIYYSINNGQVKQANEISIKNAGSYTITIWQKINNMESEKTSFLITTNFLNMSGLIWVALGVLLFALLLYLLNIWKDSFGKTKKSKNSKKGFN